MIVEFLNSQSEQPSGHDVHFPEIRPYPDLHLTHIISDVDISLHSIQFRMTFEHGKHAPFANNAFSL